MKRSAWVLSAAALSMSILGPSAVLAGLPEYQAAVNSEPSLVSYYTFDLDSGSTVLDTKPAAHNGAFAGSGTVFTAPADALGGSGQALSLNGSGWVNFGPVEDFAFETGDQLTGNTISGSVEMWIKPGAAAGTFGSNPCLAGVRDANAPGNPSRWSMHLQNERNAWGMWVGWAGYHPYEFNFNDNQWHHIVFSWNADWWLGFMYADGVLIGSFFSIGDWDASWGQPFQIGSSSPTGAEVFKGQIDEVAVYNTMLDGDRVLAHYQALNGPRFDAPTAALPLVAGYEAVVQAEPSLLSFYSFEGDTDMVSDKAGSVAAPGTPVTPPIWTNGFAGGQALGLTGWWGNFVSMGPVPEFSFPDQTGTFEAWFNPMGNVMGLNHGRLGILACADDFYDTYAALELNTSASTIGVESITEGYVGAGIPGGLPYADKWYHVAAVLNAGTMDVYLNGKPILTGSALTLAPYDGFLSTFQIGAIEPGGNWAFMGKIDEVAVYGDALTAAQVAAHYSAAAMTLSVHEHAFLNPGNMTPVSVTLSAPTGQHSSGLSLTFSFDPSIITVSLPDYGLTITPGDAYPIPDGLALAHLLVTPASGGYGTTTLSVAANPASGWLYSDSATFSVTLADQGLIIVNDHFNDGLLGTNAGQPGGGFWQFYNGTTQAEANSAWSVSNGGYNWSSGGIYSKSAGDFKFMTAQGIRIEWVINDVTLNANGGTGFPGGGDADCRHELGVISANRNNTADAQDHELFRNTNGGFYVDVFYQAGTYPTQNITVTGNVRVVNANHPNGSDGEGDNGLETPVTFTLTNVPTITPDKPLVVTIELDQTGWKVGFSLNANPLYNIVSGHPGVSIDAVHSKVVGGWDANSLGAGLTGAAITTEFANGGFLWSLFQNLNTGRGSGAIDRVKACVGCTLVTDCPDPFADANQDGFVDQADFGIFQRCWTGITGGIPDGCRCFDHDASGGIDVADFTAFMKCFALSGPMVPVPKTCDD